MCCQERLVNNYNEIFSNELGIIKGMRAKINIETNSQSEFMKARRGAPLVWKEVLEAEIDWMEKGSIFCIQICSVFWMGKTSSYWLFQNQIGPLEFVQIIKVQWTQLLKTVHIRNQLQRIYFKKYKEVETFPKLT